MLKVRIWCHGGRSRFVQVCQFSAVSGSIGILTFLFDAMATLEDIKKVLEEEEIRPLRSKLFSIEEKFDTLQELFVFMSAKLNAKDYCTIITRKSQNKSATCHILKTILVKKRVHLMSLAYY